MLYPLICTCELQWMWLMAYDWILFTFIFVFLFYWKPVHSLIMLSSWEVLCAYLLNLHQHELIAKSVILDSPNTCLVNVLPWCVEYFVTGVRLVSGWWGNSCPDFLIPRIRMRRGVWATGNIELGIHRHVPTESEVPVAFFKTRHCVH